MNCIRLWSLLSALAISVAHVQGADFSAWGDNSSGELGDGTQIDRWAPVQVLGFAVAADGKAITGGPASGYALLADGTVWAWGDNDYGQLGDGTQIDRLTPAPVSGLANVVAITAGKNHSAYALQSNGTVWAWGKNWRGELGNGTQIDQSTPVQVSGLANVIAIAAGDMSAYALQSNGTVWAWGDNNDGQLGDGSGIDQSTPVQVSGLTNVKAIGAGDASGYALLADGTVWAWGYNSNGQLGDNTQIDRFTPVPVSGLASITAIAGGEASGYAVRSNGTVWAWGDNAFGQVGDNTQTDRLTPVKVSGLTNIIAIAAGDSSAYAVRSNGTVWAWGQNALNGQVGDGTGIDRLTPVKVSGLTNVIAIGAGGQSGYAVR